MSGINARRSPPWLLVRAGRARGAKPGQGTSRVAFRFRFKSTLRSRSTPGEHPVRSAAPVIPHGFLARDVIVAACVIVILIGAVILHLNGNATVVVIRPAAERAGPDPR